jgi:hypothetical protein
MCVITIVYDAPPSLHQMVERTRDADPEPLHAAHQPFAVARLDEQVDMVPHDGEVNETEVPAPATCPHRAAQPAEAAPRAKVPDATGHAPRAVHWKTRREHGPRQMSDTLADAPIGARPSCPFALSTARAEDERALAHPRNLSRAVRKSTFLRREDGPLIGTNHPPLPAQQHDPSQNLRAPVATARPSGSFGVGPPHDAMSRMNTLCRIEDGILKQTVPIAEVRFYDCRALGTPDRSQDRDHPLPQPPASIRYHQVQYLRLRLGGSYRTETTQ